MKEKIRKLKTFIQIATTVWGLITTAIFGWNAADLIANKEYVAAIIIASLAGLYTIFILIYFFMTMFKKKSEDFKERYSFVKIVKNVLKLGVAFASLVLISGLFSISFGNLIKRLNLIWLIVTVIFELIVFTIKRFIKRIHGQD